MRWRRWPKWQQRWWWLLSILLGCIQTHTHTHKLTFKIFFSCPKEKLNFRSNQLYPLNVLTINWHTQSEYVLLKTKNKSNQKFSNRMSTSIHSKFQKSNKMNKLQDHKIRIFGLKMHIKQKRFYFSRLRTISSHALSFAPLHLKLI